MQTCITSDAKVMIMSTTRVTVSLSKEQYDRLKVIAKAESISLSELIRKCCATNMTSDAEKNQVDTLSKVELKYLSSLEDQVKLLKEQLDKKDQLIENLTNSKLVVNSNSGFRPLHWIRGLLSSR